MHKFICVVLLYDLLDIDLEITTVEQLTYLNLSSIEITTVEQLTYLNLSSIDGVAELPRKLEVSSPPIYFPDFFIFGNQVVRSVYVSF